MRGERLKELRVSRGYSRQRLAELLDISEASIPRYENGTNVPSTDVVLKIATLFNVSTDYLLGLTDDPLGHSSQDLSSIEAKIISAVRIASPEDQVKILRIVETMTGHSGTGV